MTGHNCLAYKNNQKWTTEVKMEPNKLNQSFEKRKVNVKSYTVIICYKCPVHFGPTCINDLLYFFIVRPTYR